MKRTNIICFLLLLPVLCYGQFFGVGGQYTQKSDGQFSANLSYPFVHPKNKLNLYNASGIEYTTYGGAKLSGLNIKPIQLTTYFSERLFNDMPITLLLAVDGGYLFNFPRGHKNGVIVTPNLYIDYKYFFVKTGYDFDVTNGQNQFFVRAGVGIGMGAIKNFAKTTIR